MQQRFSIVVSCFVVSCFVVSCFVVIGPIMCPQVTEASHPLGTGNASLLGGDLTDPEDKVVDTANYGPGESEEKLRPPNATWVAMKSAPVSPPGTPPHQMHAYQSWQNTPACAIFLNRPESRKWYVGFKDGGNGGPTEDDPYYCAVQLKKPYVLTHFTITTAGDMPDRDPRQWAIQGSMTGDEDDWTDIYRCDAKDRTTSTFLVNPRNQTTLFTSFTSENMGQVVSANDLKKLDAKLANHKLEKADFAKRDFGYTWYRVVIFSCFNPNSKTYTDFNRPPGHALGQLELFGVPGMAAPRTPRTPRIKLSTDQLIKPEAYDPKFIIMPWVGPPKEETTLERFQELADCGFNVAFPPNLWDPADNTTEKFNLKYLDICQQVGLKGLVWDGSVATLGGWGTQFKVEEIPQIEKVLDGMIARYSDHPAFLGFILGDEGNNEAGNPRLGYVNQYLLKKDPKHLPYYNLLPAYAFKPHTAYDRFVTKYIEDAKPALVSWDHYRQMFRSGDESTYWYNLELMRQKCTAARVPYNQIIVSNQHMGYRECSEVDLRWQVYSSLAYGSRGIQYFTYWFTPGLAWADAPALISKEGKRDKKWEYVQKINHRIAKLGPTLARLTSTGAYCTAPIPPGARKLSRNSPVKKAEGGPLAIGCFQDPEGREYFMVVNRSFRNKITASLTLHHQITSAAEISQETGKPLDAALTSQQPLAVSLEPGEGKLFVLSQSGLLFQPPAEIFGGKDIELANIKFEPKNSESKSTGTVFFRTKGEAEFSKVPLAPVDSTFFKVTLPATVTAAPFEYYIEMQEPGEKLVRYPESGDRSPLLATPDQAPPTAVPELTAPVVRSYRVALAWKPATDDRGVAGYRLHRGAADQFPLSEKTLLAEATANASSFVDDSPPIKQTAFYGVQAIDVVGRPGDVRYLSVKVPAHQPPENTLKVEAISGSKSVLLRWTGELESNVTSLEIHRSEGAGGEMKKISEVKDLKIARYVDRQTEFGTDYRYVVLPRSAAGLLGKPDKVVTASPLRYLKRINCGGPEIAAADGASWEADDGRGNAALKSGGTHPWVVRRNDSAKDVDATERWARTGIRYSFDVDPGRYEVVLLFSETNRSYQIKGKRLFNVVVNDQKLAEKVDVFTESGGASTTWQFRKTIDVAGPQLVLRLVGNPTGPAIKGIEIRGLPLK
jgi:hypothetical protein